MVMVWGQAVQRFGECDVVFEQSQRHEALSPDEIKL